MNCDARDLACLARNRGLVSRWDEAPELGAVLISGPDAGGFLQTQLTSDVVGLEPGQGQLSAHLKRTGALVCAFSIHRLPDRGQPFPTFLVIAAVDDVGVLVGDLQDNLVNETVFIEDLGKDYSGMVVQGPRSGDVVKTYQRIGDEPEAGVWQSGAIAAPAGADLPQGLWVISRSFTGDRGFLLMWPRTDDHDPTEVSLLAAAAEAGLARFENDDASRRAWDWLRLETGWPLAGREFQRGKRVLTQTGLEQLVVSNTKGCYLGQEVVARVRTYGSVPQALRGLIVHEPLGLDPDSLPEPGIDLHDVEGDRIGTWASSGWSVDLKRPVALAYLDREHRTPGLRLVLLAGEVELEAEVALLPLYRAADDAERARHLHDRSVQLFGRGQDLPAIELLEESLRLNPEDADVWEALGVMLGRAERFHEAIDIFKRLEEIAPDEPMVHTNLSLFYMKLGDKEEAERQKAMATLKKFGEGLSEEEIRGRQQAEASARHEDARKRQAMFQQVLDLDPGDPLALMGLGNALFELDDHPAAAEVLGRALAVQKDNSPLYLSRGRALEQLGRLDEAVEIYRQGVTVASRKGDLMPLRELEHRLLMLDKP